MYALLSNPPPHPLKTVMDTPQKNEKRWSCADVFVSSSTHTGTAYQPDEKFKDDPSFRARMGDAALVQFSCERKSQELQDYWNPENVSLD